MLTSDTFTDFFSNLAEVCDKPNFQCQCVYYFGETEVTTVQKPTRIVAKKGVKQVIAVTSANRGFLVTMAMAVIATGNCTPQFFLFPQKNYRDYFIVRGPDDTARPAEGG